MEKGDNVIFPNIDSCTAIVFILNSGGIEAAHHVITEKGQEFSTGVAEKNAERLLKLCTDAVSWKGEKDSIKQAIFLSNTIDWNIVNWEKIQLGLRQKYSNIPVTLVKLPTNQVNVYVFSGLQMIEVHKDLSATLKLSFQTCVDKLHLEL